MWVLCIFHLSLLSFTFFLHSLLTRRCGCSFPRDHQPCFHLEEVDYMRSSIEEIIGVDYVGETSKSEPECTFSPDSWLPRNAGRGFTDLLLLSHSAAADSLVTSPAFWFWTHRPKPGFEKQMLDFNTNNSKEVGPAVCRALLMKSRAWNGLLRNFTVMQPDYQNSKYIKCWILNKPAGRDQLGEPRQCG